MTEEARIRFDRLLNGYIEKEYTPRMYKNLVFKIYHSVKNEYGLLHPHDVMIAKNVDSYELVLFVYILHVATIDGDDLKTTPITL